MSSQQPTNATQAGRLVDDIHVQALCHECCYDFSKGNEDEEISAGLRKPKSKLEVVAQQVAMCRRGLDFVRETDDCTHQDSNELGLKDAEAEIVALLESGEATQKEVDAALYKANLKQKGSHSERRAVYKAWLAEDPGREAGREDIEVGGPEHERIYNAIASKPPSASVVAVDRLTCSWCRKNHQTKLRYCTGCRMVSYCDEACQKAAWKGHKVQCKSLAADSSTEKKGKKGKKGKKESKETPLPLTWEQLEAYGADVEATGMMLEVRLVEERSFMRQVYTAKDRAGEVRIIAAYAKKSKFPPAHAPGRILRWTNPRFHYFMDGSSGARMENRDMGNITIRIS